jgi:hypothetical protein
VNVSASGAASQPVVAAAPDGTLHALWWDAVAGEQYARTAGKENAWSKPVTVAGIFGLRTVSTDTVTFKATVALLPPRGVNAITDKDGGLRAFWSDTHNQLLSSALGSAGWDSATVLADAASVMATSIDSAGTLHLVFVRPADNQTAPAGVYYRAYTKAGWTAPALVYSSLYFRTAKTEGQHLSVAANGQGAVVVAWDDPSQGDSLYALSTDGGKTWGSPRRALGDSAGSVTQAMVTYTPSGEFFMMWRDPNASGCGFTQIRSNDATRTWTPPQQVLVGIKSCPDIWSLIPDGQKGLWFSGLTGVPPSGAAGIATTPGKGVLAVWDGQKWSDPTDVSLGLYDARSKGTHTLGCTGMTFAGQTAAVVTSDTNGDVWVARNAVGVNELVTHLTPTWQDMGALSAADGSATPDNVPALTADQDGKLYAMWSQSDTSGQGTALYAAIWNGTNWSQPAQVLHSTVGSANGAANAQTVSQAEQPALAADGNGKLHAVWVSGANGELLYSFAYARDATSPQGWAPPVKLHTPSPVNSRPGMLADLRTNTLYVFAAVPYNEKRGIYLFRSNDGGATWASPAVVFDAQSAGWNHTDKPRMALDAGAGVLHATWLRAGLPGAAEPAAVFYSRSMDGGLHWSPPLTVTQGAVDWPQVTVAGNGQVYLSWGQTTRQGALGAATTALMGQFSLDAGELWSQPASVGGFENLSGPVGLASDGAGHLYAAGMGKGTSGESLLLFAQWGGQTWGPLESLALSQPATPGNAVALVAAPATGWLGVVLQQWQLGPAGAGQFEIAATGRKIANVALVAMPTFTPVPTVVPTSGPAPTPVPTEAAPFNVSPTLPGRNADSTQGAGALVVSGVLAAVIVMGVIVTRTILKGRRH